MSKKYTYKGAVYAFNKLVATHWEASTWAVSEAKAAANLKHRFRKQVRIANHTPIVLDGLLVAE